MGVVPGSGPTSGKVPFAICGATEPGTGWVPVAATHEGGTPVAAVTRFPCT